MEMELGLLVLFWSWLGFTAENQLQECLDNVVGVIGLEKNWLQVTETGRHGEEQALKFPGVPGRVLKIPNLIEDRVFKYDAMLVAILNVDLLKIYYRKIIFGCTLPLKSDGVVVVVYSGHLGELFEVLWHCRYANVLVITDKVDMYTYHVISKGNCTNIEPTFLGKCDQITSFSKETDRMAFPNCRINIAASHNEPYISEGSYETNTGCDVVLMRLLMKKLQFTPNLICSCNASEYFIISYYTREPIDLFFGLYNLMYISSDNLHIMYLQNQVDLTIFTPLARPLEPWKNVFHIYDLATSLAILASLLVMSVLSHFVNKPSSWDHSLIYIISMLFLNDCTTPIRMKPLFLMWGFFAMLLTGLYSGLLISYMCKLLLKPQLLEFDELRTAGYSYGANFEDYLVIDELLDDPDMVKNIQICYFSGTNCYEKLVKGGFAWITSTHKLMYFVSLNPKHVWFRLPQLVVTYRVYEIINGSPFTNRMEDVLQRLAEAGIIGKIDKYQWKPVKNDNESDLTVVTLSHLYFIFVVLAFGIMFSTSCFLIELFVGWIKSSVK